MSEAEKRAHRYLGVTLGGLINTQERLEERIAETEAIMDDLKQRRRDVKRAIAKFPKAPAPP